jgi:Tol biopolymer transport system component
LSPLGRRPYYLAALLVSLLALGLIALVAPRTGSAQSTAGVIVYSGVDHNIWRINADGRSRLQLTQDGMSDNPTWVPGGSQIVFASTRDQKVVTPPEGRLVLNQIYLMGSDGSNPVRLSDGSSDDKLPDVSADGQRIIFLRNHNWRTAGGNPVRDTEIGSMRLDGSDYQALGSQVTELRTRIDRYPARISRDGSKVVVVRQEQGLSNRVQVLDVATHQFTTLNLAPDQGAAEGSVE